PRARGGALDQFELGVRLQQLGEQGTQPRAATLASLSAFVDPRLAGAELGTGDALVLGHERPPWHGQIQSPPSSQAPPHSSDSQGTYSLPSRHMVHSPSVPWQTCRSGPVM